MPMLGQTSRPQLQALVWCACAAVALAREISALAGGFDAGHESLRLSALRWGATTSAAALVVQLAMYFASESEPIKGHEENKDSSMIWREDEGLSKLVPLLPQKKGGKDDEPLKKYTMKQVAEHNKRDDLWIIVDGLVYNVTNFVDKHPGGYLPIENMAGKDCTDVFANYHPARVYKNMLPAFLIGEVSDFKVAPHVADFRKVRQELLRQGLFETNMRFYAKMGTFYLSLFLGALYLSLAGSTFGTRMLGAVMMGVFWQQLAGAGHDLGHNAVTHVFWQDHIIGSCLAAIMGISSCWWRKNHNTHHVVCNSIENDPDIQHMPLFAVTPGVWKKPFWHTYYNKWVRMDEVAKWMVSHQHILFFPVMGVARFNLYAQSWILLLSSDRLHYRKAEICAMTFFAGWLVCLTMALPSWPERVAWLLISHAVAGVLHVQIVISHWAMHTYSGHAYNDDTDDWYITQLKTSMNVDTPLLLDWVHIGLQFQIEHHLFPRLPRHNLRKAREMVKEVCKKHKIHYHEPGFFRAVYENFLALKHAAEVAKTSKKGDSGFYESALWDGLKLVG